MRQATQERQPAVRRPQQRAVETRESLVDAALEVIARHSFEGATTREIASRAERLFYGPIGAASLPDAVAPGHQLPTQASPDSSRRVDDHVQFLLRLLQVDT